MKFLILQYSPVSGYIRFGPNTKVSTIASKKP